MFHTDYFQRENFSIYGTWFWIVGTFSTACGLSSELFLLVCMWYNALLIILNLYSNERQEL